MKVVATQRGYYGSKVQEPGDTFELTNSNEFSEKWMEKVGLSKEDKAADAAVARAATKAKAKAKAKAKPKAKASDDLDDL